MQPVIILVKPQLGENIGASARAMWNCGLSDLRLVAPRDGWPNPAALANAAGAAAVIETAAVYASTAAATEGLHKIYATTARQREMIKPILSLEDAVLQMIRDAEAGLNIGVLFGSERTGLENDDVAVADVLIKIDLNPSYSSLNLGQAVLLFAYQWHRARLSAPKPTWYLGNTGWADKAVVTAFVERLVKVLEIYNYFQPPEKRSRMQDNLVNLFCRQAWTAQEINTLHGIITALTPALKPGGKK